jgi:hypothetical protein
MKSMSTVLIRITFAVLLCLGMFVTANSAPPGQRDKHERQRCEKECKDRYSHQKHDCKNQRGNDRRQCERRAQDDYNNCKHGCQGDRH